ncbi:MAG: SUMF1/EgtB/PvdO family nonheme iron enzyme, partial [Planctomycetes bacterium]|nr:SUMF1/EgtB/PvdO family nonheme iron enzyme [Planctomycetota bacterium]
MVRYLGPIVALAGVMTGVAAGEPLQLDLAKVGAGGEVGGPAYDFRIGRFEIRNEDFITFLNDALANFDNERGMYVYVDTDTGDVYVNTVELGETGVGANDRTTLMFSPAAAGQIEFVGGSYGIVSDAVDYATHPVTGVSWFGAVKFCNWLTIQVGIDPDQRCYTEAAADDPDGWHPVTITHTGWSLRDLSDEERESLTTEFLGYRLPMDHGAEVTAAFNEWYKASAYDPVAPDVVRVRPFGPDVAPDHWIFGFGRDVIDSVDANFLASGDPFDGFAPATTPVGFFDGINLLTDLTATRDTDNPYGLYDLSGNVWEWMQDRGDSLDQRRHRGGGWDLTEAFVENTFVSGNLADATPNWVGFRVVQADLGLDPLVEPDDTVVMRFTGPAGGPFAPLNIEYTIQSL